MWSASSLVGLVGGRETMIRTHVVVKADEGSGEFWEGGGGC